MMVIYYMFNNVSTMFASFHVLLSLVNIPVAANRKNDMFLDQVCDGCYRLHFVCELGLNHLKTI